MLNPFLEKRLYSVPVQPILVELDTSQIKPFLSKALGFKLTVTDRISSFGFVAIAPVGPSIIKKINSLPMVKVVHLNQTKQVFQLPQGIGADWWATSESRNVLEVEDAFKQGITGELVKLGVTDTGIDVSHPQLRGSEFYSTISWPFREILDENGHGSHCSSTAAGKLFLSPVGVSVEGVSKGPVLSVKCMGRGIGTGFTSEIVNAMSVCYDRGCQVISMSLGSAECQGGPEICPECRMVKTLTDRGVIVVVAAGNSGPDPNTIGCPGSSPHALTVAAIDRDGKVASFSSRGGDRFKDKPDVAAPGVNIYSGTSIASIIDIQEADAGPAYASLSGTSMATPHVAGFARLVKAKYPSMTTDQFKEVMIAKGNAKNTEVGWGVPKWSFF